MEQVAMRSINLMHSLRGQIVFHEEARARLANGVSQLAAAVKVTMGPGGRTVAIDRKGRAPLLTRDGVTVAKTVELTDPYENLGAQLVKEVASKTGEVVGDGTTTATVLAQAIFSEGVKLVVAGIDPMELKRGIDAAVELVVTQLRLSSRAVKGKADIARIGALSAHGDASIGDLIAEAMERVGERGAIKVETSRSMETTLEVVEGVQLDKGFLSPYFVTNAARMEAVLEDAYVLLTTDRLTTLKQVLPLLELVATERKQLLVMAESVDGEALSTLVVNAVRGVLRVCAVKAPGYGTARTERLGDLAALTGATVISPELGLAPEGLTLAHLGHARLITVDKDSTTILDGKAAPGVVHARIQQLRGQLERETGTPQRKALEARIAMLEGGVAIIEVGAASELELEEKKDRLDDALHATRAALDEGIVPGGGVALLRSLPALDALKLPADQQAGVDLVRRALRRPAFQLAANAGEEGAVVVDRIEAGTGGFGFNAATLRYEDLLETGVIDPTRVVRVALQNAASVASLMLTTEVLVPVFR